MSDPLSNLFRAQMDTTRQLFDYCVDAAQRSVLFWDAMRKRGNIHIEHAVQGKPALLKFDHEVLIDGRDLPQPCNYSLLRILPDADHPMDPAKRPFVIVDPRAGHGPGIGGFKPDSQVGVAMRAGHPVYFVTFAPEPVPGQRLAHVAAAEAHFIEAVRKRHPRTQQKPCIIGNCQAGWAVAALAAMRPEIMGPIVLNGAPLSYWAGSAKQNPMRYSGGALGGSWLASLMADLGNGVFDGAYLVTNFENLNPANTYWTKYYNLYSKIDTEEPRFLEFERWWGGHFRMTTEEIEGIVQNLFVGNRLAAGEVGDDQTRVDLRNIVSPVVVFASWGDNITPPQQALNWIIDAWGDERAIVAAGRTIVYMLHEDIGHLGIFVGGAVARKEHDQIVNTMDMIERLPPGLYEMVIAEKTGTGRYEELEHGSYTVRFEMRKMDDIRALEVDRSRADEAVFSTIAKVSAWNQKAYEVWGRPVVRALTTAQSAEWLKAADPARLQQVLLSDANPWMRMVAKWAEQARAARRPVSKDNSFVAMERRVSDRIVHALDAYRDARDDFVAQWVTALYGPLGLGAVFPPEEATEERARARADAEIERLRQAVQPMIAAGGFPEALGRMLVAAMSATGHIERRSFRLGEMVREYLMEHPDDFDLPMDPGSVDWPAVLRDQVRVLSLEPERAIEALPGLLPTKAQRELAVAIAGKVLMLEPELSDPDSKLSKRVQELLGVDYANIAKKYERRKGRRATTG